MRLDQWFCDGCGEEIVPSPMTYVVTLLPMAGVASAGEPRSAHLCHSCAGLIVAVTTAASAGNQADHVRLEAMPQGRLDRMRGAESRRLRGENDAALEHFGAAIGQDVRWGR